MKNSDQAIRLLAEANPVPDVDSLAVPTPFSLPQPDPIGESTMQPTSTPTKPAPLLLGRTPVWAWLLPAFIVVVVAAGTLYAMASLDGDEFGSPLNTAEVFLEARNNFDAAASLAVLAADASIDDGPASTLAEYVALLDVFRSLEWRWTDIECQQLETTDIFCDYKHQNTWTNALGLEPFEGGSVLFQFDEDGRIDRVHNGFVSASFSPQVWEVVEAWIADNHPDDVDTLYSDDGWSLALTDSAAELWVERSAEFAEWAGQRS